MSQVPTPDGGEPVEPQQGEDSGPPDNARLAEFGGALRTLEVGARLLVATAVIAGAAGLGASPPAAAVGVLALGYGALSAVGLRRPVFLAALRWADLGAAALAGGLVAGVADPALIFLGAAAALPLTAVGALAGGRAAGIRIAALALMSAGVGALVAGHPIGVAAVAGLSPLAAWLVWVGDYAAGLASRARARDVELARMRKEMVTTVSHELRTPLTIIQGAMATLSRRWDVLTEPERLDLVDVLIDNVASLDSSILHFVDAARLERGEFVLNPEWVDVTQTVARIRTKLTTVLSGHEVQLELNVNRVWADAPSFGRIAEHLLVNAVRFSPIGLPIRVRTELQGAEVLFSVTDRGPGIPPHLMSTLWIPLERGDVSETGVSRGAGLGLPIVRELARLHGGDADLRTAKHRGTTVTVRLPLPPGSSAIEQLTELPRSARRGRAGRRAAGAGR